MRLMRRLQRRARKGLNLGGTGQGHDEGPFWGLDRLRSQFLANVAPDREPIENDFEGYVEGAYKRNGALYAVIDARMKVFSEARFVWQRLLDGIPASSDLFHTPALSLLDEPWPNGTIGEVLARMEQDGSLAGNSYWTMADDEGRLGRRAQGPSRRLVRAMPHMVTIVLGSRSGDPTALDARIVGFLYEPRLFGLSSPGVSEGPVLLLPGEVAHYSPVPDPAARFRGMSWMTPVLRDIAADSAATAHKSRFFENAAVPNLAVTLDKDTSPEDFKDFVETFKDQHQGAWNAYRTLFLAGGADVTPLTMDFKQLEFGQTVGKMEGRIASAGGVPPSWVGFSEGMQGSSLNTGNFAEQRRRLANATIEPLWRVAAASLRTLVTPPPDARLWYDTRHIAFLREDSKDRADIIRIQLTALDNAIRAGWDPDAALKAITTEDLSQMAGSHSGLVSVQMQQLQAPPTDDEQQEA